MHGLMNECSLLTHNMIGVIAEGWEAHCNDELCHSQGLGQLSMLPGLAAALKSSLKLCLQLTPKTV